MGKVHVEVAQSGRLILLRRRCRFEVDRRGWQCGDRMSLGGLETLLLLDGGDGGVSGWGGMSWVTRCKVCSGYSAETETKEWNSSRAIRRCTDQ